VSSNIRRRRVRCGLRLTVAAITVAAAHVEKASALPMTAHVGQARLASAGGPAAGRVLGGTTAQQLPMIVTVSSNGRRMTARVAFNMTCTSGDTFIVPDGWNRLLVPASGVVRAAGPVPPIPASGGSDSITGGFDSLSGKLNRRQAVFSGFWELQLNFSSPSGQSDACDSGRVRFSIRL
jgi:hypothetical protein